MIVSHFNPDLAGSTVTQTTTVRDVAELARLTIADSDIDKVTKEFNQTLALFEALTMVDTNGVNPMVNPCTESQPLRTDRVETLVDRAGLMQNAPASEQNYFLVPRVID
jgi:aspartyl-tRNA(Asn)/glutamyl-tRNA(Gln) amidotransferase subunit C